MLLHDTFKLIKLLKHVLNLINMTITLNKFNNKLKKYETNYVRTESSPAPTSNTHFF